MKKFTIIMFAILFLVINCSQAFSQVYFGGYNINLLHEGTVELLKNKQIIDANDIKEINSALKGENSKTGVYAMGVPVLQAFEKLANVLLKKYPILKSGIDAGMRKASDSGGVKIGGYNIVVLYAGLLDALVNSNMISLAEAQAVLDRAKQEVKK